MISGKDKSRLNLTIDAILLILLMAITALGFLIKYSLIPGYKRNLLYSSNDELYFLGLTRHGWGDIHLVLGIVFVFFILLHIILHWKIITAIFKKMVTRKKARGVIIIFILAIIMIFAVGPFFVKPEVVALERQHAHKRGIEVPSPAQEVILKDTVAQKAKEVHRELKEGRIAQNRQLPEKAHAHSEIEIFGYMTLNEAAIKYSVRAEELANALNIPLSSSTEKIGRLKKRYGFEMEILKEIIIQVQQRKQN
ncbi:MAG: DUF4405 domain-containing protein [Bacteroidales bacterium]|nr:DUF4405 domain-containing protein [Bacteroidales bacterium]